uniref:Ubiquitin-related modifier 1 homolog n=1 Tax=Theileria annulata TaxID=5874 RepID=A0A3B0MM76_THEAN
MDDEIEDVNIIVNLEFSGGLDSLVIDQEKELTLKIFSKNINLGQLICYIRNYIIGSKKDFFSYIITNTTGTNYTNSTTGITTTNTITTEREGEGAVTEDNEDIIRIECNLKKYNGILNINEKCKIRPGVLVLVNNTDWELLNKENTILKNHDLISFISTLHGG